MTLEKRKNRLSGAADAISRSRFSAYLFSFLLASVGMIAVFLLARGSLSFLYETKAAGWYGRLTSLGRGSTLAALTEEEDLSFLSFAFNPINRVLALFPFSSRLAGVCLLNAIRSGLAAAAFAFFLKQRGSDDLSAVLFSVLYALSSYALISQLTGVAADGLLVLPLLLAGIERIVSRRGFALFSVSLALSAILSFRTLFGFFFFSLLWLFFTRFSRKNPGGKSVLSDLLLVFLAIPVAILISAPVLFPSFDRLLLSFRDLSFKQSYNLVEFFGKMLPATYDGLTWNRFPYLFIGMIPLLLLPIFFLCRTIAKREKIAFGVLLFFVYFTFSVNVLSAFWDLFALPDGYVYTVSVVFTVLFLAASARAYAEADRSSERALVIAALILATLISVLQRMDLSYETEEGFRVYWFSEVNSVWVPLPFLALGCAGLLAVIRAREARPDRPVRLLSLLSAFLLIATVLDVAVSDAALAGVIAKKEGTDVSEREGVHAYASSYYSAYASGIDACEIDKSLYRADKFDAIAEGDASYLGYASAAALSPEMLSAFGIEYDENGALKSVSSPLSLSLFGVRYLLTHEPIETKAKVKLRLRPNTTETDPTYDAPGIFPDSLLSIFDPIRRDDAGTVYENAYVLPVLFRAAAIPDESVLTEVNATPYSRINSVFRTLTGDKSLSLYVPAEISGFSNPYCEKTESPYDGYVGYRRNSSTGTSTLIYTVTVTRDGPLFCSFPTEYPLKEAMISANGTTFGSAYVGGDEDEVDALLTPASLFLGNYSEGDTVKVSLTFGSGNDGTVLSLPENVPFIYEIDFDAVERAFTALSAASGTPSARGESLVAPSSVDPDFTAVVSTLPASVASLRKTDGASFLGYFAAGTAPADAKPALSPNLLARPAYLLSLFGCLLLLILLFFESLSAQGTPVPFFSREAGGTKEDGKR